MDEASNQLIELGYDFDDLIDQILLNIWVWVLNENMNNFIYVK